MDPVADPLGSLLLGDLAWDTLFRIGLLGAQLLVLLLLGLTVVLFHLRLRNRNRALRWTRLERTWEPLLLEVIHGGSPPDALRERVEEEDRVFFVRFLLGYAEKLRGAERDAVAALALPYLEAVLPRLEHQDPERRAVAVRALGILGLPDYAPDLIAALEDEAPLVRFTAAQALLAHGSGDFIDEVVGRLDRFGAWTRDALAAALAAAGTRAAAPLRIALADPFTSPHAAALAAQALRLIGDPHAPDAAAVALADRGGRDLVAENLRLLGAVGHAQHAPLVRSFTDHPDYVVRAVAVGALGELAGPDDVGLLRAAVRDSSPWVALQAARALERMGRRDVLAEIAQSDGEASPFARQVLEEDDP